jgi:hypothetical protein
VIASFFFLRVLCPAIASPYQFRAIDGDPPDVERTRYFATVSKVFLMAAIGGFFDTSKTMLNNCISSIAHSTIFVLDLLAVCCARTHTHTHTQDMHTIMLTNKY